jgi:hypothetical protein
MYKWELNKAVLFQPKEVINNLNALFNVTFRERYCRWLEHVIENNIHQPVIIRKTGAFEYIYQVFGSVSYNDTIRRGNYIRYNQSQITLGEL